jgi:predicted ArsR family transcriptional regulator
VDDDRSARVAAVASLAEPTRRRLYDLVVRRREPVGRDEAAAELGLPRTTAAFHLDRLVDDGLLDVHFERLTGRTGPGAGRPAKLYRRSACPVTVALPERRYDLAGDLLADALEQADATGAPPREVLARLAEERGRALGAEARTAAVPGAARDAVLRVLEEHGFEPRVEDGVVVLVNCPFHALAQQHTALVCGMNLCLVDGVLDAVPGTGLSARLAPAAERCCVRLDPSGDAGGAG